MRSRRECDVAQKTTREVQDMIVQLREAQRLSEERYARHSREGEVTEGIAHTALASEQKKQD
jgi:hypothetical protein